MAHSPKRFIPRVSRLEDRVTPVAAVNDLTGLQGDADLSDGVADAGNGVVTLNAALQQARFNVLNGKGPETLTFSASGILNQSISADFALAVNGGSGQPILGAIALAAGGTVSNVQNAGGAISVSGGLTNAVTNVRFVRSGGSVTVGGVGPTAAALTFVTTGSLRVFGLGGSVTAVSGPARVTIASTGTVVDGIDVRGILITGDENTVRSSTFTGGVPMNEFESRVGSPDTGVGIWIDGGNFNAVLENSVRDVKGFGVGVDQTANGRAEGNTVSGNSVVNTMLAPLQQADVTGGTGMRAIGGRGTRFLENVVSGSAGFGIDAANATALEVSGNQVFGLGSSAPIASANGVRINNALADPAYPVTVSDNTVTNSPAAGIDIQNTRLLSVTDNAVTGSGGIGIAVGGASSAAEVYAVTGNSGQAVTILLTSAASKLHATGNSVERLTVDAPGGAYTVVVDTNIVGQSGGKGDVSVAAGPVSDTLSVSNNTARTVRVAASAPGTRRGEINSNLVNAAGLPSTAAMVVTGNYLDVEGNTVGGGSAGGVVYDGSDGRLMNNRVGSVTGSSSIANVGTGVAVTGNSNVVTGNTIEGNTGIGLRIDGTNNTIGTPSPGEANTIRGNGHGVGVRGHGIWVTGTGNSIRTNAISKNAGRGIALGDPTRLQINDSGSYDAAGHYVAADGDGGANNLQNHPAYSHTDAQGRVFWVLNSTPGRTFAVDFFNNPTRTGSEFGEGEAFLFSVQVGGANDPEGDGRFVFQVPGLPTGGLISATATDTATGDTSELSLVDQDGDALPDEWEVRGIDSNLDGAPEVVLPGAVLTTRDIYIEVDSMAGFAPLAAAVPGVPGDLATGTSLDLVVKSFLAAPAALTHSPGGIRLHVQLDPTEQTVAPVDFPNGLDDLDAFKAAHFGTAAERGNAEKLFAKSLAYRYSVFGRTSGSGSGSGFAEIYGNDFAVTLGSPGWRNPEYRREELWAEDQAATFMHELGHTLGLRHGGGGTDPGHALLNTDDPTRDVNYAPNYYSVMNYAWEYRYSRNRDYAAGEQDFADTWRLDFSRETLNPLDEGNLTEGTPIAPAGTSFPNARPTVRLGGVVGPLVPGARVGDYGPFKGGYASTYLYPPTGDGLGTYLGPQFVRMDRPVDWNADGDTNDTGVRRVLADKNGDDAVAGPGGFSLFTPDGSGGQTSYTYEEDPLTLLRTFAPDWSFLLFNFRESPNFPAGSHVGHGDHEEDALTIEELALDIVAEQGGADIGVRVESSGPTVVVGRTATFTVTVTNGGPAAAGAVEVEAAIPAGFALASNSPGVQLSGNTLSFVPPSIAAGATATFTFTLLAQGTGTTTLTLTATSLGDANAANNTFSTTLTVWPGATPTANGFTAVGSDVGAPPLAALYNPDGTLALQDSPFQNTFAGGVRVATGDFDGDGMTDLVEGTGPGASTQVRILSGATGEVLFEAAPFEESFVGGIYVAAGDLDGDGLADLVITPDEGGGPRVVVFRGGDFLRVANFFGIDDSNFRGGARSALGDLNGDGRADLVVAAGFGGGPRVAVYDGRSLFSTKLVKVFGDRFVFEPQLRNGAFVAVGDVDGDGFADLIAGGGPGGAPRVVALSGRDLTNAKDPAQLVNAFVGDTNSRGGVRIAVKNLDGDAFADLVVGSGANDGSRVTGYRGRDLLAGDATPIDELNFDAFPGFTGGVFVG